MRNGLLLGGLAAVLAVAALVISVIALISPPGAPDEYGDDYEFRQSRPGKVHGGLGAASAPAL